MYSKEELPQCEVIVAADLLYNPQLALQIGTVFLKKNKQTKFIITDSQRFYGTNFVETMNLQQQFQWKECTLKNFTGSGVAIEGDQQYDATIRMLSIGWDNTFN